MLLYSLQLGVCGKKSPCGDHACHHGAVCVERAGTAHCECPVCPAEFNPVCGSDGISYGNECKLRLESCKHRRDISILYDGPCSKYLPTFHIIIIFSVYVHNILCINC